mmetsp:Transcript_11173/g.11238  ORF Transcript_11173/g.11238 Transcript_11173/m.11238 type:complete len:157 (-) Transcript_11173:66-536(-)
MKGSKWGHEKKSNEIQGQSNYTLKYTTSPQMSYVMEPKEGKIDYSKSKKKTFEEQLAQQHIIKHKVITVGKQESQEEGKHKRTASYNDKYIPKVDVKDKEETRPIFKKETVSIEQIEKEIRQSRFLSPPQPRVGGWFTCQTCTTMQSARLSALSYK